MLPPEGRMTAALSRRVRVPERMDDPSLPADEHRRALAGLARINRFSGSVGVLWPAIRDLARELDRPVRVLDVATGSGDVPAGLLRKSNRAGVRLEVAGCDVSPTAVRAAREREPAAEFFEHDALAADLPGGYDVVTCSLFLHHLDEPDAVGLLGRMRRAAGRLLLVNDLSRGRLNLAMVWVACHLLSRSPVVRFDGPASVRSAFTPAEALALAKAAGLDGATAVGRFPCRFLLTWRRS
jgi:2-polyprenyl-3-methyl-5-hydroxy-6-metoxy-1,4-benzoquinol methylase